MKSVSGKLEGMSVRLQMEGLIVELYESLASSEIGGKEVWTGIQISLKRGAWWQAVQKLRTLLSHSLSFLSEVRDKVNEKAGEILELLLCD